ncbi:hypothetical protein TEA_001016 [Camellia sinensis var. sinensis]|uniref:Uncharacterized protein n=1 Tax=Camellia sinensis var. sinensis TaxID=542762 RepID=A0A4S4E9M0_CAMSN|nr:hypothetical protein TEA_001016 [Camellia sinensis var. sinensis]
MDGWRGRAGEGKEGLGRVTRAGMGKESTDWSWSLPTLSLDKSVVLWSIHDRVLTLTSDPSTKPTGSDGSIIKTTDNISIGPHGIFQGHEDTVEDVQFCPSRSAGNSVCMFDRQNLTSDGAGLPVYKFKSHKAAVLCVQWSPDRSSVFGSSVEDGFLNIWDYEKVLDILLPSLLPPSLSVYSVGKKNENGARTPNSCSGLFFQHAGHRDKVVDFHWNAADPWTVSVSDDCDTSGGGGTLQIWHMNDLIYSPEEDALAELEKFKSHVVDSMKQHLQGKAAAWQRSSQQGQLHLSSCPLELNALYTSKVYVVAVAVILVVACYGCYTFVCGLVGTIVFFSVAAVFAYISVHSNMYMSSWNDHSGNRQIQRQRSLPKLALDHNSYSGGTTEEDLFSCELWSSSSRRVTDTPIKKLLAEEMSKKTESKRQPPSVIA